MFNCHIGAQDNKHYWIPEEYISALNAGDTIGSSKYLIPIAALYDPFGGCRVLTYKSEFQPLYTRRMVINGETRYVIKNLHNYINLSAKPPEGSIYLSPELRNEKFPLEPLADKLKNSNVTISKHGDKVLVEITDSTGIEKIVFVNNIQGEELTNFKQVYSLIKYK